MKSETKKKNEDNQKRALGCAGWGFILSCLAVLGFGVLSNVGTSNGIFSGWNVSFFMYWFIIVVIPIVILSMLIGKGTKNSKHFWPPVILITLLVTILYNLFVFFLSIIGMAISDRGTNQRSFWHPASFLTTTIFFGFLLGIIAGLGYWHAGRSK